MTINYLRRFYYEPENGRIIARIYREGNIIYTPAEVDFLELDGLIGRSPADTGCMEILEKDIAIEEALSCSDVSVDITAEPPALVFTPFSPPEPSNIIGNNTHEPGAYEGDEVI